MGKNEVKIFPRFDRTLFGNPEQLFEGWKFKDFVDFYESRTDVPENNWLKGSVMKRMTIPGWVDTSVLFDETREVYDTSWMITRETKQRIALVSLGFNASLFEYNIVATPKGVDFFKIFVAFNKKGYRNHYMPKSLIEGATRRVGMPFASALLLESYFGCAPDDGLYEPIIGVEQQAKFLEGVEVSEIPFSVLNSMLESFSGVDFVTIQKRVYVVAKVIDFARQMNALGGLN